MLTCPLCHNTGLTALLQVLGYFCCHPSPTLWLGAQGGYANTKKLQTARLESGSVVLCPELTTPLSQSSEWDSGLMFTWGPYVRPGTSGL